MAFMIVEQIRKNSKEEWQRRLHEKWTDFRIWLQENGEYAAVGAFVCGLLIAYFFKFFIFLLALGVIIGSSIYLLAYSDEEIVQEQSSSDSASSKNSDTPKNEVRAELSSEQAEEEPQESRPSVN